MADASELKQKFWDAVKDDRTVMLGLADANSHPRPMTAMIEGDEGGPVWFFTGTSTELGAGVSAPAPALLTLSSKGHDVFATVHGTLSRTHDRAVIDRLWNPFIAAWYEGGKDDPTLVLLRFDPADAEIWLEGSSLVAGVKAMLGVDPKKDYQDNVGQVRL
ncbi:pyridoxamine 5'-phosphate oxidase family protein [Frateuria sp. MAH-13]|uniref:Pyridoxamine 5'-phosphate oxidase family protein n=1 Tax=Frateuria flava TaxID=2821489 RepID=A0ABS4DNA8_9GAMM|nr:pyridoxamine 5'-phosphate oxidase family protein [Frateuria flava]MBP1474533.1 pyridoxamine 5'-phosphate oxidase family protein [Frateuria flava]